MNRVVCILLLVLQLTTLSNAQFGFGYPYGGFAPYGGYGFGPGFGGGAVYEQPEFLLYYFGIEQALSAGRVEMSNALVLLVRFFRGQERFDFIDLITMARGGKAKPAEEDQDMPIWAAKMFEKFGACCEKIERALTSSLEKLISNVSRIDQTQRSILSRLTALEKSIEALRTSPPRNRELVELSGDLVINRPLMGAIDGALIGAIDGALLGSMF
ncbi:hypothetical protein TELCIR_14096 [Teladorsagia circumcincta]|uniref:SXP/RAL-2 family protein Ani s 5-like cation-binding domain-containing protein n=1 Tax=Teladorsagia circumcincta TaxID=45464 RepID=A0A2G9U219_TELCI|nr:hypothetical protein TELCIR_14096 [Teladorsagia circumcincta]